VLRRGLKVAFATGEARDERGRVVATAQGSWHLWTRRPGSRRASLPPRSVALRNGVEILPVGKIVCIGRNYAAHAAEMGMGGEPPVYFLKPASALAPGTGKLEIPTAAGEVHYEVELVVVVGRRGRSIPEERALEHVLGYAVGLDLTLRELQLRAKERGEPWSLAKGFDGSAPLSEVAPRDEVGDGTGLAISVDVNGERRQEANTDLMLRNVPQIVAEVSRWMTLDRGDLLFTGTPAGVGPLVAGDRVEARVERVGALRLEIEAAD
jgi:fumarylpyruvate hydrolase